MFSTHTIPKQTTLRSELSKDSPPPHRRRWLNAQTVLTKCTINSTSTTDSMTTATKLLWLHSLERNKSSRRPLPTLLSGCTSSVNWKTLLTTAKKHAPSKTVTMTPSTRGTRLQPSTSAPLREPTDLDSESLLTRWPIRDVETSRPVEIWLTRPEELPRLTLISSRI